MGKVTWVPFKDVARIAQMRSDLGGWEAFRDGWLLEEETTYPPTAPTTS